MTRSIRRKKTGTYVFAGLAALVAMAGITACGEDATSAAGTGEKANTSEAKTLVAAQEKPSEDALDLPPLSSSATLKGKTIAYISSGLSFPFSQEVLTGVKEGATALAMDVDVADTKGDPSAASSQIDKAVGAGADAIVLQGTDPGAVNAAISGAKKAGIPVIVAAALVSSEVPDDLADAGVSASVTYDTYELGKRLADFVVADSGGNAHVGVIGSSTFAISTPGIKAFQDELERLCPGCTTKVEDSPLPQWQTTLQSLSSSMLVANPEINYLFPLVDAMVPPVKAAVSSTGKNDAVRIVSLNGSIGDLKAIQTGKDPEVADVGGPNERMGWTVVDRVARLLAGAELAPAEVPVMTFTSNNVSGLDLSAARETFFGDYDFRAGFRETWGVE